MAEGLRVSVGCQTGDAHDNVCFATSLECTELLEYNNEATGSFVSRVETLYSAMYMIVYIVQQTLDKESMCARDAHV